MESKKQTLNEKLIVIQSELKATKDKFNKFGGYAYRSAEGILEGVKPLLRKFDVSLVISDEVQLIGNRFYIKATATLKSGDETVSSSAFAREEESKKGIDGAQLTGATSSYARKYALNGLFCIDDNKDADTEEYHNQQQTAKTTQQPVQQPAPQQSVQAAVVIPPAIMNAITAAKTVAELSAIWKANPQFQTVPQFVNSISERKKQVKAA